MLFAKGRGRQRSEKKGRRLKRKRSLGVTLEKGRWRIEKSETAGQQSHDNIKAVLFWFQVTFTCS
jgi:hypothetical protein